MREGWKKVRLGDVAERRTDFEQVDQTLTYDVVGVQRSGWGLGEVKSLLGSSMKFAKLMPLEVGNLVYRTITAFEAPSTVVPESSTNLYVTPQTFPTYRLDKSQVDPGFMALVTTWPKFHDEMATRCVGTVLRRKTLSKSAFESIPLALPPISEQHRIVDLMTAVGGAIKTSQMQLQAFQDLTDQYMMRLSHPTGAKCFPLGSLGTLQLGKMLSKGKNTGANHPYIRNANVQWGELELDDLSEMPFTEKDQQKFDIRKGDVLICEGGIVGRAALVPEDLQGIFYQKAVHRFRTYGELSPLFLQHYMRHISASGLLDSFTTGTTIKHLPLVKLKSVPVPIPTEVSREEIDAFLTAADAAAAAARAQADALRELRANLLTALLSGEHEIPESYDRFFEGEGAA